MTDASPADRHEVLRDTGLIVSIAALLAAVHFLVPTAVQVQLALDLGDPVWYTLFTAAYVHAGFEHLTSNVSGYILAAAYTYWLCLTSGRRKWFWRTALVLLVIVPIVVNAADLVIFTRYYPSVDGYSRGFSGVVGAFGGFLLVALLAVVRDVYGGAATQVVGVSLVLLLLVLVDVVYAGTVRPVVGVLVVIGILVQIFGVLYERDWELPKVEAPRRVLAMRGASGLLVVVVLAYLVLALFPGELVQGGAFVNIFAHGIGFLIGGITAFIALLSSETF